MKLLQRLCPHWFGWSYNTHRRRRWCRLCGLQQRRVTIPISEGDFATAAEIVNPLEAQRFVLEKTPTEWVDVRPGVGFDA